MLVLVSDDQTVSDIPVETVAEVESVQDMVGSVVALVTVQVMVVAVDAFVTEPIEAMSTTSID